MLVQHGTTNLNSSPAVSIAVAFALPTGMGRLLGRCGRGILPQDARAQNEALASGSTYEVHITTCSRALSKLGRDAPLSVQALSSPDRKSTRLNSSHLGI